MKRIFLMLVVLATMGCAPNGLYVGIGEKTGEVKGCVYCEKEQTIICITPHDRYRLIEWERMK